MSKAKAKKSGKGGNAKARDGKLICIDAAAKVLADAAEALDTKTMIERMAAKGLWSSPNGQTPAATLYSAILREIKTKGKESRFKKTDRASSRSRRPRSEEAPMTRLPCAQSDREPPGPWSRFGWNH